MNNEEKFYTEPPTNLFKRGVDYNGMANYSGIAGSFKGLKVIISKDVSSDGAEVVHISVSRHNRLPSYEDMKYVKNLFLGQDKMAIHLYPPTKEHVNIHTYCLHLWHGLNELGWKVLVNS